MNIFQNQNLQEENWKLNRFSNYATKLDFQNATGVDTSKFARKVDLANLKSDVDRLDIDKFKNVPSGLSTLKSKADKLDIGKLETTPVDLSRLSKVQSWPKYMRQTLVLVWNSALREKFNFNFWTVFC